MRSDDPLRGGGHRRQYLDKLPLPFSVKVEFWLVNQQNPVVSPQQESAGQR